MADSVVAVAVADQAAVEELVEVVEEGEGEVGVVEAPIAVEALIAAGQAETQEEVAVAAAVDRPEAALVEVQVVEATEAMIGRTIGSADALLCTLRPMFTKPVSCGCKHCNSCRSACNSCSATATRR